MAEVSQADIERLAARVAMLVSDDGEAANAGRAVGQLARRLGLSGGDLKELFLTGSLSGGRKPPEPTVDAQQEIATLKRNLRRLEHVVHNLQEERDRLVAEAGSLRVGMYRARANRKLRLGLIGLGALIVLGGGWAVAYLDCYLAPRTPPRREAPAGLAGTGTTAVIRSARGTLYSEPDKASAPVSFVPIGTRLPLRRLVWNMMTQWAEVDLNGKTAFVPTTEIEMF